MTARATCEQMNDISFGLVGEGIALDANMHVVENVSASAAAISWRSPNEKASLIYDAPSSISEYLSILSDRNYSFLMKDGGIIQASYIYVGSAVSKHRLAYYCCPYDLLSYEDMVLELGIVDTLDELVREDHLVKVQLRSSLRFDYDPESAKDYHPASHLTFSSNRGRIPLTAPFGFARFIKFVFETFYEEHWQTRRIFKSWRLDSFENCLSEHDRSRTHIAVG